MQRWLLSNQLWIALVCAVLLVGMVVYRLMHTVATVAATALLSDGERSSNWKQQQWMIGRTCGMLTTVCMLLLRLCTAIWQTLVTLTVALLPVLVLSLMLLLLEARAGSSIAWLHDVMNSSVVTQLWNGFFTALQALTTVSAYVLPAYNLCVYLVMRLPLDVVQWLWHSAGVHTSVALIVREVGAACGAFVPAVMTFVDANFKKECMQLAFLSRCDAVQGTLCVDTGLYAGMQEQCLGSYSQRGIPLAATVFPRVQNASVALLSLLDEACALAAPLSRVLLYPLIDSGTWEAVDRFVNAALYVLVGMPATTVQRCALAPSRASMCTPDVAPAFDIAVEGSSRLGEMVNRWGDVAYASMMGIDTDVVHEDSMRPLWAAGNAVFGSNQTAWVTLTQTTAAWTDGVTTVWVHMQGQLSWRYALSNWPFAVDLRHGLAAVHLPSGTEGVMGCTCTGALTLTCAILNSDDSGNSTAWTLPVTWSLPTDVDYLSCSRLRVVVQSLRWPAKRLTASRSTAKTCLESGSCASADALLYAIPVCGADGGPAFLACAQAFTRVSCFPYCMALRMRGSGPFALVMRGAAQWKTGVLLAGVDCAPSLQEQPSGSGMRVSCGSKVAEEVELSGSALLQLQADRLDTNPTDACAFDSTCVTFLANRSDLQRYAAPAWPPAYADANTDVLLMQKGQPLVVGGSVHMRGYSSLVDDGQYYADFPQLVGDQYNEFTMEVGLGVGIPAAMLPVPSQQDRTTLPAGTLWLPPAILTGPQHIHPATQTPDGALWYAVNPYYESLECLAIECSRPDVEQFDTTQTGCMQIAIGSTYERMSVWRVETGQGLCYVAEDGVRVCSPDVARFTFVDRAKDIMRISDRGGQATLMQQCFKGTLFNLYVESVEYFDDLNVILAVRRGSVKDLYRREWAGGADAGQTVFYFVSTANMSFVQEGRPFSAPGLMPPSLRFLPRLGDVVGLGMRAALRLLQMPANLLLNPFAFFEVLAAWPRFPSDTLYHGALARCDEGPCIVSLDAFFLAAHDANDAAWRVAAWFVTLVHSPSHLDKGVIESFLSGAVTTGETQQHLQLFGIVSTAEELFDTGVEAQLLPGGRRRLLGWKTRAAKRAGSAGKYAFSQIGSALSSGISGIFSLSQNLASMNLGGNADFGILLVNQDPTYLLGSHLTSFPMAWSQFTYRLLVLICMDVLSSIYGKRATLGAVVTSISVRLYESHDMFEDVVQAETRQACLGLQAMMRGFSSSLSRALYYNCLSAGDMGSATYKLANLFTVDAMLYRCLCVQPSTDVEYLTFVRGNCMALVPSSLKAKMLAMLRSQDELSDVVAQQCDAYAQEIEDRALTMFDAWTTDSTQAASALGSVLSDMLMNSDAGCTSRVNSPYSVAMTPLPLDHFRVCGTTSMCKLRCAKALEVFEAELARQQGQQMQPIHGMLDFDVEVESPFFPMFDGPTSGPDMTVWALSWQPMERCGCLHMAHCVVVVGLGMDQVWRVQSYCLPLPSMLQGTVRAAEFGWTLPEYAPEDVRYLEFLPAGEDPSIAPYVLVGLQDAQSRQVLRVLWPSSDNSALEAVLVDSESIAATALSTHLLQFLHADSEKGRLTSANLEVISSSVDTVLPIASSPQEAHVVCLFLRIQVSYRALYVPVAGGEASNSEAREIDSVVLHAITRWCDHASPKCKLMAARTAYYLPCQDGSVNNCKPALDAAIDLADRGTLLHIAGTTEYWALPSYTMQASASTSMRRFRIMADGSETRELKNQTLRLDAGQRERSKMGLWSQSSVFSSVQRAYVRSPVTHNASSPHYWLQYASSGVRWVNEMRPTKTGSVYVVNAFSSMQATGKATLQRNCSAMSCGACAVGGLRLLCHSAQDCLLSRCIGTMVSTQNVLCGAGGVMESMYLQMCASWRAIYLFVMEIAFYVMRGLAGEKLTKVVLKFPTARFYELVCVAKDLFASYAALATSVMQTLSAWLRTGLLNLDQGFDIISEGETVATYQYQSIGQALFNVVTTSTLYPILTTHRWLLCVANVQSTEAMLGNSISIVFGDVTMDNSWGACEPLSNVAKLLDEDLLNVQDTVEKLGNDMAGTAVTLVSGVSEAVFYMVKLNFEGFCTMLSSVVWSVQVVFSCFALLCHAVRMTFCGCRT